MRLWDINAPDAPVFKAKNVKPDMLQLEQPVWITDLAFVPGTGDTQIVAATAHKVLRIFDIRASARAVLRYFVCLFRRPAASLTHTAVAGCLLL